MTTRPEPSSPSGAPTRSQARGLARDFAILSVGELASKIAGFVGFAYLARTLAPADYGVVELAATLVLFFSIALDFGVGSICARDVARDPSRAGELAGLVPAARHVVLLAILPTMWLAVVLLRQPPAATRLLMVFSLALIAFPWMQRGLLQGLDLMSWVAVGQLVRMAVFAGGVLCLVRSSDDLLAVAVVDVVGVFLMAAYFTAAVRRFVGPIRVRARRAAVGSLLRDSAPVGFSHIVSAANQFLPMVLVAVLVGGEQLAWFGATSRIVVSLITFVALYHFNLFPTVARTVDAPPDSYRRLSEHSFRVAAWSGVFGALLVSMLSMSVCTMAFGPTFRAAAVPLAVAIWVIPLALLSGHARYALVAYGHQRDELVAQLGGVVLMLVGGPALTLWQGAVGAAFAMLLSACATWAVAHAFARARIGALPALQPLVKPALAAIVACTAASLLPPAYSTWSKAALAAGVMLCGALLSEPRLLRDFRSLLRAPDAQKPDTFPLDADRGA